MDFALGYHTAILVDEKTPRYHPMPFRLSPRPSETCAPGDYCRHKSIGHHTEGFATLEEAEKYIDDDPKLWPTGVLIEWENLDEVPATTMTCPAHHAIPIKIVESAE